MRDLALGGASGATAAGRSPRPHVCDRERRHEPPPSVERWACSPMRPGPAEVATRRLPSPREICEPWQLPSGTGGWAGLGWLHVSPPSCEYACRRRSSRLRMLSSSEPLRSAAAWIERAQARAGAWERGAPAPGGGLRRGSDAAAARVRLRLVAGSVGLAAWHSLPPSSSGPCRQVAPRSSESSTNEKTLDAW